MSVARRFLRAEATRRFLCRLIALWIRLVYWTSSWRTVRGELPAPYWDEGKPFILAFWHGRLMMAPMAWRRGASMNMLISGHQDGRIIADAIKSFDLGTITGSRSRGGSGALRAILRAVRAGQNVGFTPDGPRGPAMRASAGIIAAARLTGAPILPLSYATSNGRVLRSWDRFHVALPCSRGIFIWGEPILVAPDADAAAQEAARRLLEQRLNAITAEADRYCGRAPVEPAPLAAPVEGGAAP
jgi:lysophospholipid acyltransferase (LPLAT)-like uncharacterized protein